jgi:hypothetical protein
LGTEGGTRRGVGPDRRVVAVVHPVGWCYTNRRSVYLPIPKNASTTVRQALGWRQTTEWVNRPCPLPGFVVVRDPIDRYFSGVAEYAKRSNQDYDRLLDRVEAGGWPVFDEHTMRQSDFILSTYNLEHVRMENLGSFLLGRFGLEVDVTYQGDWIRRASLIPMIRDFYADDFRL